MLTVSKSTQARRFQQPEKLHLKKRRFAGLPHYLCRANFLALAAFTIHPLFFGQPVFGQPGPNQCKANSPLMDGASGFAWNGWGADVFNSRFQPAEKARLTAAQIARLRVKWAFGIPGAKQVFGEPAVFAGRVFLSADTGAVYSVDAGSGCEYWKFQADAGVRTALSIRTATRSGTAYFGDQKANVYAL